MKASTRRSFLHRTSAVFAIAPFRLPAAAPARTRTRTAIREALESAPLANTHEHTAREDERLREKMDVFTLYQGYSSRDLHAAGLRAKVYDPSLPVLERWRLFVPYWQRARNTGYVRAIDIAVRDLFGGEELNDKTIEAISARVSAGNSAGVNDRILRRKCRTPFVVLDDKYSQPVQPESPLFRTARRFDKFILATSREALQDLEKETGSSIATLREMETALEQNFAKNVKMSPMVTVKTTIAYQRPLLFRKVTREQSERDFERVAKNLAPPRGKDAYAELTTQHAPDLQDYLFHRIVQLAQEHRLPMQIHTGIQAGQNVISNSDPMPLTNLFFYYPNQVFDLFHSGYPYMREALSLAKMFSNVYIDMCWTHIIAPSASRQMLHEYLDTIPSNKVLGFGGDCRYAEQSYGHSVIARDNIIRVLEEKAAEGDFTEAQAIEAGKRVLHDNAAEVFLRKSQA